MRRPDSVPLPLAREAARALGSAAAAAGTARVPIAAALGCRVAEDVVAAGALPRFDASAMDGFALRAADVARAAPATPVPLVLGAEARAGHAADDVVGPGAAARISTGAPLPSGADTVVRQEDVREEDGVVRVVRPVAEGHDVRRSGEDVAPGDVVLRPGALVHPGTVALLAGLGVVDVAVRRPPSVVVLVTGDEVVAGGTPRGAGPGLAEALVHDVNGEAIPALLAAAGAADVRVLRVGDDHDATVAALRDTGAQLVVTCGGMSVGRHDHVRRALREAGAREQVAAVAMKPGGPTWLGALPGPDGPRTVVGLPGNPGAAMVGAVLFACPALRASTGGLSAPRYARLAGTTARDGRRHRVLWATTEPGDDGVLRVRPAELQHAHRLRPAAASDVLVVVPPGADPLPAGAVVEVVSIPGAAAA